jgi:hypothetical protein
MLRVGEPEPWQPQEGASALTGAAVAQRRELASRPARVARVDAGMLSLSPGCTSATRSPSARSPN